MFAKLVALILAFGACGGGLLAMRQSRLQAAHELAESRLRVERHELRVRELRAQIAARITPEKVIDAIDAETRERMKPAWTPRIEPRAPEYLDETHEAVAPASEWGRGTGATP